MFLGRMMNTMMNSSSSLERAAHPPSIHNQRESPARPPTDSQWKPSGQSSGLASPISQMSIQSITSANAPLTTTPQMILRNHFLTEKVYFVDSYSKKQPDNAMLSDFIIQRRIGGGSFGTVVLALHGKKQVAMKVLEKQHIIKLRQTRHVIDECRLLGSLRCPLIVQLVFKFKDNANLYLCLEFISGGEVSIAYNLFSLFPL